ncbi:hypothetical protein GCM10027056_29560 [Glaciibacter psychrotolerans]
MPRITPSGRCTLPAEMGAVATFMLMWTGRWNGVGRGVELGGRVAVRGDSTEKLIPAER